MNIPWERIIHPLSILPLSPAAATTSCVLIQGSISSSQATTDVRGLSGPTETRLRPGLRAETGNSHRIAFRCASPFPVYFDLSTVSRQTAATPFRRTGVLSEGTSSRKASSTNARPETGGRPGNPRPPSAVCIPPARVRCVPGPGLGVTADHKGQFGRSRHARTDPHRVSTSLRRLIRESPHVTHERGQDWRQFAFAARRQMVWEPHPVCFDAVGVVPLKQLLDQGELMAIDFRNRVVDGPHAPSGLRRIGDTMPSSPPRRGTDRT